MGTFCFPLSLVTKNRFVILGLRELFIFILYGNKDERKIGHKIKHFEKICNQTKI